MSEGGQSGRTVGGVILVSIITVALIVLKCCEIINWKWIWVLSPLWMSSAITVLYIIIGISSIYIENSKYSKKVR